MPTTTPDSLLVTYGDHLYADHLDFSHQEAALERRLEGASYPAIATEFQFRNANAAMYACIQASVRRVGDDSLTSRFRHRHGSMAGAATMFGPAPARPA